LIALALYFKFLSFKIDKLKPAYFAYAYAGLFGLFVIPALVLLFKIDPYSLEVDRWSALHGFISYLFEGKFPYMAPSHLGSQASPLPVMNFIAVPFYLLGDVGYLQIFIFAAVSAFVFFSRAAKSAKMLFMLAFLSSPAFWYEVAVRSELVSNIFIMCLGLLFIEKIASGNPLNRPFAAGIISGLIFCTRGVFIIPFTVFFFARFVRGFKEARIRRCVCFAASVIAAFALALLPFVLWDIGLFAENNPFSMQTNKSPMVVQLSAVAAAALLSFNARSVGDLFIRTSYCLFALMAVTIAVKIFTLGWGEVFFEHKFDITYCFTAVPFAVLGMLCKSEEQLREP
jgi:hypothetical protein